MNYKKTITTIILLLILLNFSTSLVHAKKYSIITRYNNEKEIPLKTMVGVKAGSNSTKENKESSTIYYELGIITVITITLAALIIYNKRKTKK